MSRRRGEFEHRTSIFEGAFRAWSHLGGIDPADFETKTIAQLDPLNFPLENDTRPSASQKEKSRGGGGGGGGGCKSNSDDEGGGLDDSDRDSNEVRRGEVGDADGNNNAGDDVAAVDADRRDYPYEPLPRSGLAHPFVQAILSPWLGPDADQDAIQLGLTTLRTWWQHRRKGESGSAIAALGTDKMRGVVEGYTRHFFHLAYSLVVNDKDPPPRTLQSKMKDMEKTRIKKGKKRTREDETMSINASAMAYQSGLFGYDPSRQGLQLQNQMMQGGGSMMAMGGGGASFDMLARTDTPLERLHEAQRRQFAESGGLYFRNVIGGGGGGGLNPADSTVNGQPIEMKRSCLPDKIDIPGLVQQVSSAATQFAHRGMNMGMKGPSLKNHEDPSKYGDPQVTPVVLVSTNQTTGAKDVQFYMTIEGITCAHCVKIIETVLKGCPGSCSPINGLLDAAADMNSSFVIIKIDNINNCRRIAWESARNLSMVGYIATARSFVVPNGMSLTNAYSLMEQTIPSVAPMMVFRWDFKCECPDNNVARHNCSRLVFAGSDLPTLASATIVLSFDIYSFRTRLRHSQFHKSQEVLEAYSKTEMLLSDPVIYRAAQEQQLAQHLGQEDEAAEQEDEYQSYQVPIQDNSPNGEGCANGDGKSGIPQLQQRGRQSIPRLSFSGIGGPGRLFSLGGFSETTFARSMSGLSALSIDWENMDDFDINIDHSAGINNDIISRQQQQGLSAQGQHGQGNVNQSEQNGTDGDQNDGGYGHRAERRSSMRCNIPASHGGSAHNVAHNVSFNM